MGLLSSNIQCCATFFINFEFTIVTKCFKLLNYIINYARYLIGLYLWYTGGQMHRYCHYKQHFASLLYKPNRFHVANCWYSNRSQMISKFGYIIRDTLGCFSCPFFLSLLHFDIICDLLLNRCIATWNLFVNPLQPNISMHILHTVLHTFSKRLTRRICLTIKSCSNSW